MSGHDLKTCSKCHEVLHVSEFYKDKQNKSGLKSWCVACCKKKWAEKPGRPRKGRKEYVPPTEKHCKGCDRTLPADSFYRRADRADGKALYARCKECQSASYKSWAAKNPGASRERNLKSKYGIDAEEYMRLLEEQGGGCALCGSEESRWESSPWLHVDHDHETGEVRGLLCHLCNIAVGCIENTPNMDVQKLLKWCSR
jgi:hypothetical protein